MHPVAAFRFRGFGRVAGKEQPPTDPSRHALTQSGATGATGRVEPGCRAPTRAPPIPSRLDVSGRAPAVKPLAGSGVDRRRHAAANAKPCVSGWEATTPPPTQVDLPATNFSKLSLSVPLASIAGQTIIGEFSGYAGDVIGGNAPARSTDRSPTGRSR
jgi:hypothetical protein